ncbi:hypothetical protein OCO_10780 [Mycobacterium intracellulare MOTT-02]|nr:hypothetical protein OCO_10780 [Mycobacterium intracellulare MOTT-02]
MGQVGPLVEVGATDLRLHIQLSASQSDTIETLRGIVTAFRKAAQRNDPLPE